MKRVVSVTAAAVVALAGCSSSGKSSSAGGLSGTIQVYAASSLTEAFDTLATQFMAAHSGTTIKLHYGPSSQLSTQIGQGADADVFASASEKNLTSLGAQALSPTDFVKNKLEIAVPPDNPANVTALADLAKSGVKVAVCDPTVPCGAVAQQVFANARITVKPVANEADVKSTLAAVESNEVDAGLVYVTDVRAAGPKAKGITIPAAVNASTTYPIAALKDARNATLARAFVDYVLSSDGKKVLTADGFEQP